MCSDVIPTNIACEPILHVMPLSQEIEVEISHEHIEYSVMCSDVIATKHYLWYNSYKWNQGC